MVDMEVSCEGVEGDGERMHESRKLARRIGVKDQQLLPEIPDEITLDHVALGLSWTACNILSSVSRSWQRAIGSRQVYDARLRSQSTQTLIALKHHHSTLSSITVYSLNDNSNYQVPPIPGVDRGIPYSCQCVSLAGNLYILGGLKQSKTSRYQPSADVYEFDLAGLRQWKERASMKDPREEFGCGVIGGKIYVFGGTAQFRPVLGCEVYDPEEDAWSLVTPRAPWQFEQEVTTVGEDLFVQSGLTCESEFIDWARDRVFRDNPRGKDYIDATFSADVYLPLKDDWREVENGENGVLETEIMFMVKGKLYKMRMGDLQVYDTNAKSWQPSQRNLWDVIGPSDSIMVNPLAAVVVEEELLALVYVRRSSAGSQGICLVRSQGLGEENKELVWREAQCSLPSTNLMSHFMCPVQV